MKFFFNLPIASTIVSLLSFASLATSTQAAALYASGSNITVSVLGSTAAFDSYLWLASPYRRPIASNRETGKVVNFAVSPGEELLFELQVSTGYRYYTGDASRNPDGIPHAKVSYLSPGVARVGFEDIFGGGDWDFDDHTFMFYGVSPTPETVPTLESFFLNGRNGNINIFEGQSVSATLSASDRDGDNLDFYVNNRKVTARTSSGSSGSASTTVPLGLLGDDGSYTQTAQVIDEDGRRSQTITRTVNVQNVAPTVDFNFSSPVINEGDSAFAELFATDPGADAISFFLNDENIGTDTRTSGNRFVSKNLGVFADNGTFTYTARAEDDDGGISNILAKTLTVNNLDPIISSLTEDFTIHINRAFDFTATATDPGINDILTFDWDLDGDGLFDDFTGSSGEWSFSRPGLYAMNLRVSDGDGGVAYGSIEVNAVPEPSSVFGLLTLGALGVGSRLRKRKFQ
ncbi:hypothetical protein AFK68_17700 [Hydrocoleum sp. CS-953]|uniref:DUF4114 domain-containing protein n=1 Tax=Hydrocoleum sp. CS-953 TaxID=1671698 RepID=UPI000B9B823D|nr:DUF4114 domain-containing protein [Hydrocoleum sp. CS-953]OZH53430.1 hypothetical protein AFK68_17700 [Hydrocoleum sp. CS-953]